MRVEKNPKHLPIDSIGHSHNRARHAKCLKIKKSCLVTCLGLKQTKVDFLNTNTCFCSRLYVCMLLLYPQTSNWTTGIVLFSPLFS